jgi:hypothetical protein
MARRAPSLQIPNHSDTQNDPLEAAALTSGCSQHHQAMFT